MKKLYSFDKLVKSLLNSLSIRCCFGKYQCLLQVLSGLIVVDISVQFREQHEVKMIIVKF